MYRALNKLMLHPAQTMRDAVARIQINDVKILLVVDANNKLMGTVTDGDIRRALLQGQELSTPVRQIMNETPVTVDMSVERDAVVDMMKARIVRHIPRIDADGCVIGLELLDDQTHRNLFTNEVIIMAGGRGERLRPLTDNIPKPMIKVGGKPILEKIIDHMSAQGFRNFTISVNYLADMITEYFGDGRDRGVRIRYVREAKRLGTAGSLSLVPAESITQPFLVVNGDILTRIDFQNLATFHAEHGAEATLCVRDWRTRIPFGVVQTDGPFVSGVAEKPEHSCLINAGLYMLNPTALTLVPKDEYFDMTDLINSMIDQKCKLSAFHIDEDWVDIGQPEQLRHAQTLYSVAS
ncbi:MAG TPA: nucleotidyltransferase family protein [Alphaproteobacteria bacterium]